MQSLDQDWRHIQSSPGLFDLPSLFHTCTVCLHSLSRKLNGFHPLLYLSLGHWSLQGLAQTDSLISRFRELLITLSPKRKQLRSRRAPKSGETHIPPLRWSSLQEFQSGKANSYSRSTYLPTPASPVSCSPSNRHVHCHSQRLCAASHTRCSLSPHWRNIP